jgi:glycosyltransferase involved in cell wall biosynthesis
MKKISWIALLLLMAMLGHFIPKLWKVTTRTKVVESPKESVKIAVEKPFVIVIPSYNNAKWCEENLRSVFEQNYDNYRVIYIDDASTDGMDLKVKNFIAESKKQNRVQFLRNEKNLGAMANLFHIIHSCKNDEIVIILDGDDWLAHENVLSKLNEIYADSSVWISYGSYVEYPSFAKGSCARLIPKKVIQKKTYRQHQWSTSHLRTFYAGLFKKIDLKDFLYEGRFLESTWDMAAMFPMLEMAGKHARFVKDVLYVYNRSNPLSDDRVRPKKQIALEKYIRNLPVYPSLEEIR